MRFLKKYLMLGTPFPLFSIIGTACSNQTTNEKTAPNHDMKLISDQDEAYIGFVIDTLKDERWYKDKALFEEEVSTDKTINNDQINVPSILLDPIAVTKENVRETVIKDGYLKEEEVFK